MNNVPSPLFNIAVFASGAGSNARRLITYFEKSNLARVVLVGCNKPDAGVLDIAAQHGIPSFIIEKETFFRGDGYVTFLKAHAIDLVVLAGFLWKVPQTLLDAFPQRIINIHPALLPRHGGKGMWGRHVHEAVLAAGDKETGITIHFIDGQYDAGQTIFQARCAVAPGDDAAVIAQKVQQLEHAHFPEVVEKVLLDIKENAGMGF